MMLKKALPVFLCFVTILSTLFIAEAILPIIPGPPLPPPPIIPPGYEILPPLIYECDVWINVLVAGDEEFTNTIFYTPQGGLEGERYAELQIRRGTIPFARDFGIGFVVRDYVTWDSEDSLTGLALYTEVLQETGFYSGMRIGQWAMDMLIAFTGQDLGWAGWANWNYDATIICPIVYWADDHLIQHEVSHLFGASDGTYEDYVDSVNECYMEDCVMSYRKVWIDTVVEDGVEFDVGSYANVGYTTDQWCDGCSAVIEANKNRYEWWAQECHGDGC